MRILQLLTYIYLVVITTSCASQTLLTLSSRERINSRHQNHIVSLRQSCYYGDLYDENEMWLLSPYPFDETSHIINLQGEPIHPQGQRGIIPAGSSFIVKKIEFPDSTAMAKRMLTTPRYNPWIYLIPTQNTITPTNRKYFILLLPMNLAKETLVESAIAKQLAEPENVNSWLKSLRPTIRAAILNKDIAVGMKIDELTAAMGTPLRWFKDTTDNGDQAEVAWYPTKEAWIIHGFVNSIKPSRKVP
ncbi:MAG: hypothetical protein JW841_05215 [Deltaproteobacteria bacterium]|nr:hypothetical protein [Deltaproteobacteria bacterium]